MDTPLLLLLAVCLSFFPPSAKFQILLERYISLQMNSERNPPEVPISIYAKVCQKRLEKILQTGPKKGLRKPTYEEIELSKVCDKRESEHCWNIFLTLSAIKERSCGERVFVIDERIHMGETGHCFSLAVLAHHSFSVDVRG